MTTCDPLCAGNSGTPCVILVITNLERVNNLFGGSVELAGQCCSGVGIPPIPVLAWRKGRRNKLTPCWAKARAGSNPAASTHRPLTHLFMIV